MKFAVFIALTFLGSLGLSAPQYLMGMDAGKGSSLWLEQRKITGKLVYVLGHQSITGKQLERALPKSEYLKIASEMNNWMKENNGRKIGMIGPGCSEAVFFKAKSAQKIICLDALEKQEKVRFSRWFDKTVNTTLGIF